MLAFVHLLVQVPILSACGKVCDATCTLLRHTHSELSSMCKAQYALKEVRDKLVGIDASVQCR